MHFVAKKTLNCFTTKKRGAGKGINHFLAFRIYEKRYYGIHE